MLINKYHFHVTAVKGGANLIYFKLCYVAKFDLIYHILLGDILYKKISIWVVKYNIFLWNVLHFVTYNGTTT